MSVASSLPKRIFDRAVAAAALAALSPVMLGAAIAVRATMGSPVLFRQRRPGLGGVPFECLKFRTMSTERDARGALLPDDRRLTRVGRALRATSLDELPQLLNVLRGEMSIVGPRPLLMQYLSRYSSEQARRHDARPGITGWAQVNGRNAIAWDERFALDVWYVDHYSFWLDMKILALTLERVLRRQGISNEGHATMPEFMGTEARVT
jgi:lipopolysaccharide/colanic/teichoic acid biosynthesis glycosyltransferase